MSPAADLRLAGIDLLHAGRDTIFRSFGRAEPVNTAFGIAHRYRDSGRNLLLEFVLDDESGAVRSARLVHWSPKPEQKIPAFRLPTPNTGSGIRLGDTLEAVRKCRGTPSLTDRRKPGRIELLYRYPAARDGYPPACRIRHVFDAGKLTGIYVSIGE